MGVFEEKKGRNKENLRFLKLSTIVSALSNNASNHSEVLRIFIQMLTNRDGLGMIFGLMHKFETTAKRFQDYSLPLDNPSTSTVVYTEEDVLKRSRSDWKLLFDLIPEIEQTTVFGENRPVIELEDGSYQFPSWINGELISRFTNLAQDICVIHFDWTQWKAGSEMYHDLQFDYDTVDVLTKCKLISAILRAERFCDGVLATAFENGTIVSILKSLEKQLK